MSVRERDPLTGHSTTGHEWNGITELNTRVPRPVWFFIAVTHIWALGYWVLMPSWPLVHSYTKGLLGFDDRERVERRVAEADAARSDWTKRLAALTVEEIRADPALMAHAKQTAHALFADNCAACHGRDAAGGPGFPSLVDGDWLWGGDAESIVETLRVGINSPHPESRVAEMIAFGATGVLTRPEVRAVADYVQSLSGLETEATPERLAEGEAIFAENCASCHGEDARGMQDLGAPNLTDGIWLYGDDDASLFATIHDGRRGWMPAWEGRMTEVDRKLLAVHVLDLGEEAGE